MREPSQNVGPFDVTGCNISERTYLPASAGDDIRGTLIAKLLRLINLGSKRVSDRDHGVGTAECR